MCIRDRQERGRLPSWPGCDVRLTLHAPCCLAEAGARSGSPGTRRAHETGTAVLFAPFSCKKKEEQQDNGAYGKMQERSIAIDGPAGAGTVSYTHLDVYKRQAEAPLSPDPAAPPATPSGRSRDVYKRQTLYNPRSVHGMDDLIPDLKQR